jgi:3-phenylpropionate/trans-cinnamate dioxygenase ferredoxin subunit
MSEGLDNWINVCQPSELSPGRGRLVEHDGVTIAVYNLHGEYFALTDHCTHDQFPLLGCGLPQDLLIHGEAITCPRHGARFCIRTGAALSPPAYESLGTYPVRVADGMLQVGAGPGVMQAKKPTP